jgi:hypothetical protein
MLVLVIILVELSEATTERQKRERVRKY